MATKNTSKKVTVTFTQDRETKGTFRFREDGDKEDHAMGSAYVKKGAAEKLGNPEDIKITIEAA